MEYVLIAVMIGLIFAGFYIFTNSIDKNLRTVDNRVEVKALRTKVIALEEEVSILSDNLGLVLGVLEAAEIIERNKDEEEVA